MYALNSEIKDFLHLFLLVYFKFHLKSPVYFYALSQLIFERTNFFHKACLVHNV